MRNMQEIQKADLISYSLAPISVPDAILDA